MNKIKVSVLFGGQSSEHEVSRISAQCVLENIDRSRFEIQTIGITKNGEWLKYEGDISLIGTGHWEEAARSARQSKIDAGISNTKTVKALTCKEFVSFQDKNNGDADVYVVFPVLHGPNGEDGSVQGLLQLANVPYVGCNILSSAAGMDKEFSKLVFDNAGIPQADYIKVMRSEIEDQMDEILSRVTTKLGLPCFVKPANAGSSVGVSKVKRPEIGRAHI